MGPLFFLVLLVPFTLNGFAVREAFFVSFLGSVGVDADAAFAAGFLFFLVTVALALPGGVILLWEGDPRRRAARGRAWLTPSRSSPPTTRCRGSSSASRASTARETVVVDNGSTDGTVAFVARALPRGARGRAGEPRPRGRLGSAASRSRPPSRWALILNADAWLVGDALERLVAVGDAHPRGCRRRPEAPQPGRVAAAIGARLPDASGASRPSTSTCASSAREPSC